MFLYHMMYLAMVKKCADCDAATASKESIKLFVGFTLAILVVLLTDDVVILTTAFAQ